MKTYLKTLILLFIVTNILFVCLVGISSQYIKTIEDDYKIRSQNENLLIPSIRGSAMGLDYVHTIDIYDSGYIITFGASTSILGMLEDELNTSLIYRDASSGSASIQSMMIMKNYLELKNDDILSTCIIKVDISPVIFKDAHYENEVITSALEYASIYDVHDDLSVTRNIFSPISQFYGMGTRYIEKAYEYFRAKKDWSIDELFLPAIGDWSQYHRQMTITQTKKEMVMSFITDIPIDNCIVDILYQNNELKESQAGLKFNEYIDDELIPFLNENYISFIDSRDSVDSSYFLDSNHLSYEGRVLYTRYIDNELKKVFGERYE